MQIIKREVEVSRRLAEIAFWKPNALAFFTDLKIQPLEP